MKRRIFPLLMFGVAAIILYVLIDDFVQQIIVKPVLRVAWIVVFVLESLPQLLFWLVFIVVAIIIARRSFDRTKTTRRSSQAPMAAHLGPVATWSGLLERAKTRDFSRWRLAQAMRNLTRDILFPTKSADLLYGETRDDQPEMDLPPEIDAYFGAPVPRYQRLSWLPFRRRDTHAAHGLKLDPERVVEYLEEEIDPLRGE